MSPTLAVNFLSVISGMVALLPVPVLCQCSEAHRQTCSWSQFQLDQISTQILPPHRYIPDYNETSLRRVCNVYRDYRDCSKPFLASCQQDIVRELTTLDNTLGLICGELFNGYIKYRVSCFRRLETSYQTCRANQKQALKRVDITSATYRYKLCRSTCLIFDPSAFRLELYASQWLVRCLHRDFNVSKEYVMCIFSTTALGCSIQAADIYFKLLKQSIGGIFTSAGLICEIRHPMEVISLYTTTPSTTVTSPELIASSDNSFRSTKHENAMSRGCTLAPTSCVMFTVTVIHCILGLCSRFMLNISDWKCILTQT